MALKNPPKTDVFMLAKNMTLKKNRETDPIKKISAIFFGEVPTPNLTKW